MKKHICLYAFCISLFVYLHSENVFSTTLEPEFITNYPGKEAGNFAFADPYFVNAVAESNSVHLRYFQWINSSWALQRTVTRTLAERPFLGSVQANEQITVLLTFSDSGKKFMHIHDHRNLESAIITIELKTEFFPWNIRIVDETIYLMYTREPDDYYSTLALTPTAAEEKPSFVLSVYTKEGESYRSEDYTIDTDLELREFEIANGIPFFLYSKGIDGGYITYSSTDILIGRWTNEGTIELREQNWYPLTIPLAENSQFYRANDLHAVGSTLWVSRSLIPYIEKDFEITQSEILGIDCSDPSLPRIAQIITASTPENYNQRIEFQHFVSSGRKDQIAIDSEMSRLGEDGEIDYEEFSRHLILYQTQNQKNDLIASIRIDDAMNILLGNNFLLLDGDDSDTAFSLANPSDPKPIAYLPQESSVNLATCAIAGNYLYATSNPDRSYIRILDIRDPNNILDSTHSDGIPIYRVDTHNDFLFERGYESDILHTLNPDGSLGNRINANPTTWDPNSLEWDSLYGSSDTFYGLLYQETAFDGNEFTHRLAAIERKPQEMGEVISTLPLQFDMIYSYEYSPPYYVTLGWSTILDATGELMSFEPSLAIYDVGNPREMKLIYTLIPFVELIHGGESSYGMIYPLRYPYFLLEESDSETEQEKMSLLDLSDFNQPKIYPISYPDFENQYFEGMFQSNYAFSSSEGVSFYELTDQGFTLLGTVPFYNNISDIEFQEDMMYLARGNAGLDIYRLRIDETNVGNWMMY